METPLTPAPVPQPLEAHTETEQKGSFGSVLAIILIVILLVLGAFYVWGQRLSEQRTNHVLKATGSSNTSVTQ